MMQLSTDGWTKVRLHLDQTALTALRHSAFEPDSPGQRSLLDNPFVRDAAIRIRSELIEAGFLPQSAVAIQAIAFDKTPSANWKVTWHQDLMFPYARPVTTEGYELPTKKDGIDYARPPRAVLETLLAVRLHLDPCDETNGPLRVSPGSHLHGVLSAVTIPQMVHRHGSVTCLADEGEALLMKPLLLHASSPATTPKHRRVLHFVFYSGCAITEAWHQHV